MFFTSDLKAVLHHHFLSPLCVSVLFSRSVICRVLQLLLCAIHWQEEVEFVVTLTAIFRALREKLATLGQGLLTAVVTLWHIKNYDSCAATAV